MSLTKRSVGDVMIVSVTGEMTAGTGIGVLLKDTVRSLLQQGHRKLLIDLAGVPYMDTSGLGELVQSFATTENRGGSLKLMKPTRRIKDLLTITKLQSVFECCDSEADALAAFSSPAS